MGIEAREIERSILGIWGGADKWVRVRRLRQSWEKDINSEWILGVEVREIERGISGFLGEVEKSGLGLGGGD